MLAESLPGQFHARNRIISGLSRALIVVEAGIPSGAIITAKHATEQGREVYVVPGPVDSAASEFCNKLIRDGARLIRSVDDVLEDLHGLSTSSRERADRNQGTAATTSARSTLTAASVGVPPPAPPQLTSPQQRVYEALASRRHADELARELNLPVTDLARLLMQLEMKKTVRRLPGNFYERR
jgi:DNA processing protein